MLKKFVTAFFCTVFISCVYLFNSAPIVSGVEKIEVYLFSSSSNAVIKTVDVNEFSFISNVKGECVKLKAKEFDLEKFLSDYGAQVILTESFDGGKSYYAYSPKIRYRESVCGERVNLQVAIRGQTVTVGSPIIYGSF